MRVKQTGFTLIELVAVVVLLGILAVAALPRFINLQGDAKRGVLEGLAGSMQSAATQVYAKSLMQGKSADSAAVLENGADDIDIAYGFPVAVTVNGSNFDIENLLVIDSELVVQETSPSGAATVTYIGYDINGDGDVDDDNCFVSYTTLAAAADKPSISDPASATGCQ